ncbi:MAG: PA14 domain-containing protein, partial [Verrucomicrobiae bacterium]|nr:PA14 domain-containing protein [Verrucomicrobiae bacterium]
MHSVPSKRLHRGLPPALWMLPVMLLAPGRAFGSADYGPAVDRLITGCTKWYTTGYGKHLAVVHTMQGYYASGISYLRRCDVSVSCHYVVNSEYNADAPAGELSQLVREAYYAWHASCWNRYSLGVEHEGFVSNPAWYTETMYQTSAALFRHFCDKFNIPKDRNHIVGHNEYQNSAWVNWVINNLGFDPRCNDHTDPGPYWNWSHFMNLIIGQVNNAAVVGGSVPSTVAPGQTFTASITMRNSGTKPWTSDGTPHRLGSQNPQDNTRWGLSRVGLPTSPVNPGQNVTFTFTATAPTTPGTYPFDWRMVEDGVEWFGATFTATITVAHPPPTITSQPATQTKNPGETATFTVAASSSSPLTYQWRKNGVNLANGGNISGATSPTLTIANVQLADAAFYSCVVANAGGSVSSAAAQLVVATTPAPPGTGTGLRGLYYDNTDFSALKLARVDGPVNFDWGNGSPHAALGADTFAVRWIGQVEPRYSQTYTFYTGTDDGVRLWVNGVLLIDRWNDQAHTEWSGSIALTAGQKYDIRMDYYENGGAASAQLRWSSPSQVKEIIPASQLYRPKPVLAAIANQSVTVGNTLNLTATTPNWDEVAGVTLFEDFESYPDGSPSDQYMFRKPGHSSTTSGFLDPAVTNYSAISGSFPAGRGGARVCRVSWSFLTGTVSPWLRLATFNAAYRPNPIVDITQSLWFDLHTDKALKVGVNLRETNPTGAIGDNGGTTGPIEFVGVPGKNGDAPNPSRTVPANTWTTLKFMLPDEPVTAFTGNGLLESTTGKAVLEALALVPAGGMGAYNLYLDNFTVVQNTPLTYSLDAAPAGATIDAQSGAFTWTPPPGTAPGNY